MKSRKLVLWDPTQLISNILAKKVQDNWCPACFGVGLLVFSLGVTRKLSLAGLNNKDGQLVRGQHKTVQAT